MKPRKLKGKLILKKTTVANLKQEHQKEIVGGATFTCTCNTLCTCPTILCCPETENIRCPFYP